jgi:hypothetical protein
MVKSVRGGRINMKYLKVFLFISILILVSVSMLSACSNTKEYEQVFQGESDNWNAELIQTAKVIYRDHKELENQYEIDYERYQRLKITYIGNETNLGTSVEYSMATGGKGGSMNSIEGELITVSKNEVVFNGGSGTTGTSHIPKDMEYKPVDNIDRTFSLTIKWKDKEEKLTLVYRD